MTRAVPEKHIINFFWPYNYFLRGKEIQIQKYFQSSNGRKLRFTNNGRILIQQSLKGKQ